MAVRHLTPVPGQPPAIGFAEAVRTVSALARRRGLQVPVFRSPPGLDDVDRTLRRRADGAVVVAIRLTDRPFAAVQGDVIAGIVAANGLTGRDAGRFRRAAWTALGDTPGGGGDRAVAGWGGPAASTDAATPNVGVA